MELSAPDAVPARRRKRPTRTKPAALPQDIIFYGPCLEAFLLKRPLLQALESDTAIARRCCWWMSSTAPTTSRRLFARAAQRLSDHDPRAGHDPRRTAAGGDLTSNRTREIHDALKRRCVYAWIEYPDFAKERRIVSVKVPGITERLADQVTAFVPGTPDRRPLQVRWCLGNARLGDCSRGPECGVAVAGRRGRHPRRSLEEPGGHPGSPR